MNKHFVLINVCYLVVMILSGCSTIKEMGKGFAGVSTQVLEDKRKDALKKSFALSYNDCYAKVKDILAKGDIVPYIYSEDSKKKLIAIYLAQDDTTPVGIFFTEESAGNTLIEISSPSTYAREEIAKKIFTGIDTLLKPKVEPQKPSAQPQNSSLSADKPLNSNLVSNSQSQEEKKTDVEKKSSN